jgi:hypothetical protein
MVNCPDFNKDSKAWWKKWQQIYKSYKYNKSINVISRNERCEKCMWYLLVDEYMFDHPNVISHTSMEVFMNLKLSNLLFHSIKFLIVVKLEKRKKE